MSVEPASIISKPLVQRIMAGADIALADLVYVAFDTETTGLRPPQASVVELSGVKFGASGEVYSSFSELINPCTSIPPEATAIHGIDDSMVAGAPLMSEVLPKFLTWACDTEGKSADEIVLLAHNAAFDVSFIQQALNDLSLSPPPNLVLDTLALSRRLVKDSTNHQLATLIDYFGIKSQTFHRALADSYHVMNLFLSLTKKLPNKSGLSAVVSLCGKMHLDPALAATNARDLAISPNGLSISKAIDSGANIKIQYAGVRLSERVVTPRSLSFSAGNGYLNAFCHEALAERVFRLDKIIQVEFLDGQDA